MRAFRVVTGMWQISHVALTCKLDQTLRQETSYTNQEAAQTYSYRACGNADSVGVEEMSVLPLHGPLPWNIAPDRLSTTGACSFEKGIRCFLENLTLAEEVRRRGSLQDRYWLLDQAASMHQSPCFMLYIFAVDRPSANRARLEDLLKQPNV